MLIPRVVQVAVEQTSFHFDKPYSYILPEAMGQVKRGCRVMVPFGGGNRCRQGIILSFDEETEVEKLKPIQAVLDREPLLSEEMLNLALWLKERTFCTVFDAVRAMIPTGLYMKIRPVYRVADPPPDTPDVLSVEERRMLLFLRDASKGMDRDRLLAHLGLSEDSVLPESLTAKGFLLRTDDAYRLAGDATVRMVRLAVEEEDLEEVFRDKKCTEKQKSVLRLLAEVGCASVKELCYFVSVTPAVVTTLLKKGLLTYYEEEVLRTPYQQTGERPPLVGATLSEEQQTAYDGLLAAYREDGARCALLYGVTGSGKTQVYMNLINEVLADGKQVLVLVPEISLTPQMMNLFLQKYGSRVALLHSGLSIGERMDEWKRIRRGDAQIVVGTRSAVFAPFQNIGLIVMDEEQEHTYKSESSPRYHAREVAKFRCARQGALLLLTSATPSMESYYAAKNGRYRLCRIDSRFGNAGLPKVEIVDMREEMSPDSVISHKLEEEMRACLDEGRQVILLLNRRGYNTFVSCRSCGHVMTCPSCSISMTYHRANNRMVCHYCGHMEELVHTCPECGSDKVRYAGLGTQRVEQELEQLFPGMPVLRMDTDTTMSRFAYEKKFRQFAEGNYRIMVGTQMVAKGLDFPNVGLVGVLSADQALFGDDYRCFETAFSLLTQVIGRAGRRDVGGKAVIQTYNPDNHVIDMAARQDYDGFYDMEIAARKMMRYPPYTHLCLFGFVGQKEEEVKAATGRFLKALHQVVTEEYSDLPVIVLDPGPAVVYKVAGKFRYKLLMKMSNSARARKMIGELLTSFSRSPENRQVTVFADINPVNML